MAKSSSSKDAVDPAHHGPGGADAPSGGVGNANLGSLGADSRGRKSHRPLAQRKQLVSLRDQLDVLYRDTIAASEAARRWFDGPGRLWREELPPQPALAAAMEALGVTTRLLAVMNWLLNPAHDGPAHDGVVTQVGPIDCPLPPPLPADHPLLATDGAPIALASRQILARAHHLANAHGETP
jgi:Protein of unknown function (DUF1465)